MTEKLGAREVTPRHQDFFTKPWSIPEERIAIFCNGCDFLGPDNICKLVDANDQGRYVEREICGWAKVGSVHGVMTLEGFLPNTGIIDISKPL